MTLLFRRLLLVTALFAVTPTLGACAGTFKAVGLSVNNPLTANRLVDLEAAYGIAQAAAKAYVDNYRAGHKCTVAKPESLSNFCSRRSVVVKIQRADANAQVALATAKSFIQRNPTLDPSSVIDGFQTAVEALKQVNAKNGV